MIRELLQWLVQRKWRRMEPWSETIQSLLILLPLRVALHPNFEAIHRTQKDEAHLLGDSLKLGSSRKWKRTCHYGSKKICSRN